MRGWIVALALAAAVALVLPADLGWTVRAIAGWDAALVPLLGLPWWIILHSDADRTRQRAAVEDPGKILLLVTTVLASAIGLAAAVALLSRPRQMAPALPTPWLLGLGITAVTGAWLLVHTAFALHYAHLYYREDGEPGGLEFPGDDDPDDLDFVYFAFTIGMTFQTSDVEVSDRGLRRTVLRHALLAFVFNTTILALAVSLLFGRVQ